MSNFFVGLITHENSKYYDGAVVNQNYTKLISVLSGLINDRYILKKNLYKTGSTKISSWVLFKDVLIQYKFTKNLYRKILSKKKSIGHHVKVIRIYFGINLTFIFEVFKFAFVGFSNDKIKKALRQINITLAHMSLMEVAIKSESKWALIVEDDIQLLDYETVLESILFIEKILKQNSELQAINVSQSFGSARLGMQGLEKVIHKDDPTNSHIEVHDIPNTDTVCATIYRVDSLPLILEKLNLLEKFISIPIDIKLNIVYEELVKEKKFMSTCYGNLVPGILIQKSLEV